MAERQLQAGKPRRESGAALDRIYRCEPNAIECALMRAKGE
jgi:hypothetical protein